MAYLNLLIMLSIILWNFKILLLLKEFWAAECRSHYCDAAECECSSASSCVMIVSANGKRVTKLVQIAGT